MKKRTAAILSFTATLGLVLSGAPAAQADVIGGRGCTQGGGTATGVYYSAGNGGRTYEAFSLDCGTVSARSGYVYNASAVYWTGWVSGSSQATAQDPPYTQVYTEHKATYASLFRLP